MGEYIVVPKYHNSKIFPISAIVCQFATTVFICFGLCVTTVGFILAFFFQFCSFYYGGLYFYNKFYRLNMSSRHVTIWNIFNKSKSYQISELRWRIRRIPWYNSYFVLLYASNRIPVAVVKPHWENALRLLKFPHLGKLSSVEIEYLKFLKRVGLLC